MVIYSEKKSIVWTVIELVLTLIINAFVILMATNIFKGLSVSSFGYAILTSIVILILNKTVKPIIKVMALPLTIYTLGLFYPFINVIILKLAALILGNNFVVEGWIVPFFVSIFISLMTIALDALITKQIVGGRK